VYLISLYFYKNRRIHTIIYGYRCMLAAVFPTRVLPNDSRLAYSNYLHLHVDGTRAVFDRCYDFNPDWPCGFLPAWKAAAFGWSALNLTGPFAEQQTPGATVGFVTDARTITAHLEYTAGGCAPGCPTAIGPAVCYQPLSRADSLPTDTCQSNCEPLLYVDGVRAALPVFPLPSNGRYDGLVARPLISEPEGGNSPASSRLVEIVMPWGGAVVFRGLELYRGEGAQAPRLAAPEAQQRFLYIAYGDSITHGYCAETP
jgi:hypothetical protein